MKIYFKTEPRKLIKKVVQAVEIIISIVVLLGVLAGIPDLVKHIWNLLRDPNLLINYQEFSEFLKHVLMLVVGLELIYMIISHQNESILTLVLFVIARKMLVYADGMIDILLGTLSVVLVFVAFRYFVHDEVKHGKLDGTFSAHLSLKSLETDHNIHIQAEDNTLGGFIFGLAKEEDKPLMENTVFRHSGYIFTIRKMNEGLIERVSIVREEEKEER